MKDIYESNDETIGIIGNIDSLIDYIQYDETIDMCEYSHILIDLKELREEEGHDIFVRVYNYNGFGYNIQFWEDSDRITESYIKKKKEERFNELEEV